MFENTSNFPRVSGDGLCPYPAGHYWLKNLGLDATKLRWGFPEGLYRITLVMTTVPNRIVEFIFYLKLSRESFW